MTNLFSFGLGYSAGVLAQKMASRGWTITGTSTTAVGAARIATQGYRGLVFDGLSSSTEVRTALGQATHVILSIPPDANGDPAFRLHGNDIASSKSVSWIGYFSTVAVYGDAAGGWVNEETAARPQSERGQRRLDAETTWLSLGRTSGMAVNIFRLPGIYGPGRSAIDDLRDGSARRIIKPNQVFNRIHVEDIAAAVVAAIDRPNPGRVYNVTDDEPAPSQEVVAYAAELLGLPIPPDIDFATAELSPMARSFYAENKRVSNTRMKAELGIVLAYPTYRQGLRRIAEQPT